MSKHSIKTGLGKAYKDMLSAVKGQMCDGYWENTPMMQGYWRFCEIGTAGDEVTIDVDDANGTLIDDRFIENRFRGMSDDAVKKFFADKIKFLIKEEGLGKWDRGNENETDFLSYGKPRYRVKDCYYAYEILKGRNARKHPEYVDVAESFSVAEENEWWQWFVEGLQKRTRDGKSGYWNENCRMTAGAQNAYSLLVLAEEFANKWNIGFRSYTNKLGSPFFEFAWTAGDAVRINKEFAKRKLKGKTNEALDDWDGWEEIEGLEDALDGIEDLAYELRSCVRGAKTRCKDWQELSRHIQNLASKLDDAAGEMMYRQDDESKHSKK